MVLWSRQQTLRRKLGGCNKKQWASSSRSTWLHSMPDVSWLLCLSVLLTDQPLISRPASKLQRRPCWALQLFGTGRWWCTLATLPMALSGAPILTAIFSQHAVHCVCCPGTDIQDLCRLGWTQKCWDPSANPVVRTACRSACTRTRNLRELTAHSAIADTVQEEVLLQRIFGLTHDISLAFASVMLVLMSEDKNHHAAATWSPWLVWKSWTKALNSLSALRQLPRTFEIR